MDYSQVHDPDHPAGTSPWNSSPRQSTHPSFSTSTDAPPSPLSATTAFTRGPSQENSVGQEALGGEQQGDSNGTGSASVAARQEAVDDATSGVQDSGIGGSAPRLDGQGQQLRQQPRENGGSQGPTEPHPRPARYQGGTRGQRNAPHYKVQAKITGLERTGRKDPILRFDVHVGYLGAYIICDSY